MWPFKKTKQDYQDPVTEYDIWEQEENRKQKAAKKLATLKLRAKELNEKLSDTIIYHGFSDMDRRDIMPVLIIGIDIKDNKLIVKYELFNTTPGYYNYVFEGTFHWKYMVEQHDDRLHEMHKFNAALKKFGREITRIKKDGKG